MTDCLFCKIIEGEVPSYKVYEDDDVFAFLDIYPINPGHTLIIPKKHEQHLQALEPEIVAKLFQTAAQIDAALRHSEVRCEDVLLFVADGPVAGQEIPHMHIHVVPRFVGDGFSFAHGPKNRQPLEEQLGKTMQSLLRAKL